MSWSHPCPFCGGDQTTTWHIGHLINPWVVECWDCGARGPRAETEAEAVDKWNERAKE